MSSQDHSAVVYQVLGRTLSGSADELTSSITHLTASGAASPDLVTAAIGFDTNAVFSMVRSKSAAVIDFLATQHNGPLVMPGQVLVELWNQREDLPSIAAKISSIVAELERLVDEASSLISDAELDGLIQTVRGLSWSEVTSLTDAQERLRLLLNVIRDRGSVGRVPRDSYNAIGRARLDAKVPPGFEDRTKDRGALGDFYVWADFLVGVRQTNPTAIPAVVFVTNDSKRDWRTTSGRPHPILCAEVWSLFSAPLYLLKYEEFRQLCPE